MSNMIPAVSWAVLLLLLGFIIFMLWSAFGWKKYSSGKTKTTAFQLNKADSLAVRKEKQALRGTVASIIVSVVMLLLRGFFKFLNGEKNLFAFDRMLGIFFGYFLGNVLGYLADILLGTDEGLGLLGKPGKHFAFGMKKMGSWAFYRFIVTVLLDMFISDPIMFVMKEAFGDKIKGFQEIVSQATNKEGSNALFWFAAKLFSSSIGDIMMAMISFITFQLYTNDTRFFWAYPSPDMPMSERIPTSTIVIALGVSAAIYLVGTKTYTKDDPSLSLLMSTMFVLLLFGSIYKFKGNLNAPYKPKVQTDVNMTYKSSDIVDNLRKSPHRNQLKFISAIRLSSQVTLAQLVSHVNNPKILPVAKKNEVVAYFADNLGINLKYPYTFQEVKEKDSSNGGMAIFGGFLAVCLAVPIYTIFKNRGSATASSQG